MLFRRMKEFAHKVVSQADIKKFQNHMCYLGSEMAPLSLFSSKVFDDEKMSIVEALILSGDVWSVRGITCPVVKCNELEKKQVHALVTSSSLRAFFWSLGPDVTILFGHGPLTSESMFYGCWELFRPRDCRWELILTVY